MAIPTRTWKIAVILDKDRGIDDVDSANVGDTYILIQRINAVGENLWNDSLTGPLRFLADSKFNSCMKENMNTGLIVLPNIDLTASILLF